MALLLLGIGLDDLSMSPSSILTIKKMIRSVRFSDIQRICREAMQLATAQEVEELVSLQMQKLGLS